MPDASDKSVPAPESPTPRAGGDVPRTMVPEVRFRLAALEAIKQKGRTEPGNAASENAAPDNAAPRSADQASSLNPGSGARFGGADVLFGDLASSVRAIGGLSVQSLAPVDASKDVSEGRAYSTAASAPRSWLVTGSRAEVSAFLANLADAGSAAGYEVSNGEIAAAEVDARIPLGSVTAHGLPSAGGPASPGPAGPTREKAAEPSVRVVVIIESKAN